MLEKKKSLPELQGDQMEQQHSTEEKVMEKCLPALKLGQSADILTLFVTAERPNNVTVPPSN